jgi:hypothetical protein
MWGLGVLLHNEVTIRTEEGVCAMSGTDYIGLKTHELELDRLARRPYIELPVGPYHRLLPAFEDDRSFVRRAADALISLMLVRRRRPASPVTR